MAMGSRLKESMEIPYPLAGVEILLSLMMGSRLKESMEIPYPLAGVEILLSLNSQHGFKIEEFMEVPFPPTSLVAQCSDVKV